MMVMILVITAVMGLVLLAFYWKGSSASPDKARKRFLGCILVTSLLINVGFIIRYVASECIVGGGGQFEQSPNGLYQSQADSLRPLLSSAPAYYVLKVKSINSKAEKVIRIDTGETTDPLYFRRLPRIIEWSDDSKHVVFRIPGVHVAVEIEEGQLPKIQE